jgi:hypothetical protein
MKLIEYIKVNDHSEIGILDLYVFKERLGNDIKRDIEKEGAKFLLEEMLEGAAEHLFYDEHGKPHLRDLGRFISISHSHDRLAMIINKVEHTGIDIELIREKVLNIRHKFLCDKELEDVRREEIEKHLVYWAAKESLYKIHGRKKVDFRDNLFIFPFSYKEGGAEIKGRITLPDYKKTFLLHYEKKNAYMMVYMIKESE